MARGLLSSQYPMHAMSELGMVTATIRTYDAREFAVWVVNDTTLANRDGYRPPMQIPSRPRSLFLMTMIQLN